MSLYRNSMNEIHVLQNSNHKSYINEISYNLMRTIQFNNHILIKLEKKKTYIKSCECITCMLMLVQMTYCCGSSARQHKLPVSLKQLLG